METRQTLGAWLLKHGSILYMLSVIGLTLLICAGVGGCKKWRYDECIKVGHGAAYCAAEVAGCFNSRGKR